jgi:hypothetical protein
LYFSFDLLAHALYLLGRAASDLADFLLHFSSNVLGRTF